MPVGLDPAVAAAAQVTGQEAGLEVGQQAARIVMTRHWCGVPNGFQTVGEPSERECAQAVAPVLAERANEG